MIILWQKKLFHCIVGSGGQVVSVLAFYSNDPSSNPADIYSFFVKCVLEKNENKRKNNCICFRYS